MRLVIVLGAVLLIAFAGLVPMPSDKVVFLDVGQGDAILLQHKTSQVLIDGGQGMAVLQRLGEEMPWFDRRIEVIVSTHPDRDHLEGLFHVLERYEVGLVVLPRVRHDSQLYQTWLERLTAKLNDQETAYRFGRAGQKIIAGDMEATILGPQASGSAPLGGKSNNASVITRVDYHGLSFLLTGDAEASVERALVVRCGGSLTPQSTACGGAAGLRVDVLKAGHHGSKTSTSAALVEAASPSAAVISVGADSRFGHPHQEVLERIAGIQVWRTDKHGSVQFERVGDQWLLSCGKNLCTTTDIP